MAPPSFLSRSSQVPPQGSPAAIPTYNDQTMAVKIRVPVALRQLTRGAAIVEVNAADVSQALDELNQKYPGFKERLYDDKGELRQFINIYRNDEDIRFGSGLKTPLKDSDDLSIIPAVAGGSPPSGPDDRAPHVPRQCPQPPHHLPPCAALPHPAQH